MYRRSNNTNNCSCMNNNNSNQYMPISRDPDDMNDECNCGFNDPSVFPENYMYGQSYVPIQYINTTFKPNVALQAGSLFPELVSPYSPCQDMAEDRFIRERTANEGRCPNAL